MTWLIGYSNIIANMTDRRFAEQCFKTVISGDHSFAKGYFELAGEVFFGLRGKENKIQIQDLLSSCNFLSTVTIRTFIFFQHTPFRQLVELIYRIKHGKNFR